MKFDYNYFTKSELVEFLNKYGEDFKYMTKPYLIMIESRRDKFYKELELIHKENDSLLNRLIRKNALADISGYYNISKQMDRNDKEWAKIHQELDKLDKKLAGD